MSFGLTAIPALRPAGSRRRHRSRSGRTDSEPVVGWLCVALGVLAVVLSAYLIWSERR